MRKFNFLHLLTVCILLGTSLSANAQSKMYNFPNNPYFNFVETRAVINSPASVASILDITTTYNDDAGTGWGGSILQNIASLQNLNIVKAAPYEACVPITNGAAVKNNVCIIKRGNCEFGEKAKRAQDEGAVAVIIVNNVPGGPVGMGAGAQGANVTIPVIMISDIQGDAIVKELDNSQTVNMSFSRWGNGKTNDLAIVRGGQALWHSYSVPYTQMMGSGTPQAFKGIDGAVIANYGTSTAKNVKLERTLYWTPKGGTRQQVGNVESVTYGSDFAQTDSIIVPFIDKTYDITPSGEGRYDVFYKVSSDNTDDYPGDDTMTYSFYVDGRTYSKSRFDFANNVPFSRIGYRSTTDNASLTWGPMYFMKNANYQFEKMHYGMSVSANSGANLNGRPDLLGLVYKWVDGSNNGNADNIVQGVELTLVGVSEKKFGATDSSGDLYSVDVRDANDASKPLLTEANTWYWTAVALPGSTGSDGIFMLCDGDLNYFVRQWARLKASSPYREPYNPLYGAEYTQVTADTFSFFNAFETQSGINPDSVRFSNQKDGLTPSIALQMSLFPVGVNKIVGENTIAVDFYPNPVSDVLNARINFDSKVSEVRYTIIDAVGRIVYTSSENNIKKDKVSISTESMNAGQYYLIVSADGKNIAKKFVIVK